MQLCRLINRLRQQPQDFLLPLQRQIEAFQNNFTLRLNPNTLVNSREGKEAWLQAYSFLQKQKPIKKLKWSKALYLTALEHAFQTGVNGTSGPVNKRGQNFYNRINRHGLCNQKIAQAYAFGTCQQELIVLQLLVDDGVKSRSNRNLLFSQQFEFVGCAVQEHKMWRFSAVIELAKEIVDYKSTESQIERLQLKIKNYKPQLPQQKIQAKESKGSKFKSSGIKEQVFKQERTSIQGRPVRRTLLRLKYEDGTVQEELKEQYES